MQHALLDTMARQVGQRCEERLAKAREHADAILADARSKAEKRRTEAIEHAQREVKRLSEHARQLAALQIEQEALSMRQSVADEVLQSVSLELERIAQGADFPAILDALLREVMTAAPRLPEVLAPAAHVDRVRSWLRNNGFDGVAVVESTSLKDGVAVQDTQRSFRITNSLSSRFQKLEHEARKTCMRALFEGGT